MLIPVQTTQFKKDVKKTRKRSEYSGVLKIIGAALIT
jgi:mRNA-degrading endonuclease YafQ of YafQ-DinJ toxin-antitoxin module